MSFDPTSPVSFGDCADCDTCDEEGALPSWKSFVVAISFDGCTFGFAPYAASCVSCAQTDYSIDPPWDLAGAGGSFGAGPQCSECSMYTQNLTGCDNTPPCNAFSGDGDHGYADSGGTSAYASPYCGADLPGIAYSYNNTDCSGSGGNYWVHAKARFYGPCDEFCLEWNSGMTLSGFTPCGWSMTGGTVSYTTYGPIGGGDYIEVEAPGVNWICVGIAAGACS